MTARKVKGLPSGRGHSGYSDELAGRICQQIADGKVMREVCTGKNGFPASRETVYNWLDTHPDFAARYARAVRWRFEALVEDAMQIIDTATPENVTAVQARVSYRQWVMKTMMPRRFGAAPDETTLYDDVGRQISRDQQKLIEADPLYQQVVAWEQAAEKAKT